MDFDTVAVQLYAAGRDEFVAARNARSAEAKAAGDQELAERIKKLRKPSTAAWLVNHVAAGCADEIAALAELGQQLRRAHTDLDGARLRELTAHRRRAVSDLVDRARTLAQQHDVGTSATVLDQVRATFDAAVGDAAAAAAVASGRLDVAVSATGMDEWLAAAPTAAPPRRTSPGSAAGVNPDADETTGTDAAADATATVRQETARLQRHQRQLADARQRAADAEAEAERAQQQLAGATADADAAKATVRDLQSQLVRAQRRERDAVAAAGAARREHDRCRRAADNAHRDVLRLERS